MLKCFQTPTYSVIMSNWVVVSLLKTLLKLLKTLPKLNICEKQEKQFWKACYTTKSLVFSKGKKTSSFFVKDLCQIYFVQKKKLCWKLLVEKASVDSFGLQKENENKAFIYKASTFTNDKTVLILFKAKFAYGQKTKQRTLAFGKKKKLFFVLSFWELLFLFVKMTMLLCKTIKHFFCFKIVQNQQLPLIEDKPTFFSCLRSWEVQKKVCTSEMCKGTFLNYVIRNHAVSSRPTHPVMRAMLKFAFFLPTHLVMNSND